MIRTTAKRVILAAYAHGLIGIPVTQWLIDRLRLWGA